MDNTFPHQQTNVANALSARIYSDIRGLKDSEADSVLEFLYIAYADVQGQDPEELKQYFIDLDNHLQGVTFEENNEFFSIVCSLCSTYEKRAFMDAIQIGACLVLELLGN